MRSDENSLYNIKSSVEGRRCCLFDIATWKNGLVFKRINLAETGVPVIKIAELNNGIGGTTAYTEQKFSEDVHLKKGDLLFSWSGNPQTSIDIFRFNLEEGWLNQHIFKVTPDENVVDRNYFYFLMKNLKSHFTKIATNKQTTGLGHVTIADIKRMSVIIPSIDVQRKIVSYIKPIDDKIVLNNEINNNLEEQAMTLFKSWFIDYEPFDKQVLTTWKYGVLGNFVEIKRGGSPRPIQNFLSNRGLHWLKISDATCISSPFVNEIKEYIIEEGLKKTVFLKAGSLVLSNSATPGLPKILDIDTCIHDGWLYFPSSKFSNEYLYLYFKYIRNNLVALGNGSVFTNLKTDILKNYPTNLPTDDVLNKFDKIVKPIFSMILSKTRESKRLIEIRDTLLPKLMSGELDVSNIDF